MAKFFQYMTRQSLYDGVFDESGWAAAGMGDAIVTQNGKIIVIDGGFPEDAQNLIEHLKTQTASKTVNVDHWIITHPHLDHYGALQEISENAQLQEHVAVKNVIYWFPNEFCNKKGEPNALQKANTKMLEICARLHAQAYTPARGDILLLDDVTVQFVYVPDDCSILNTAGGNANSCSLIFTVSGKHKKVMVTGDAYRRSLQITAWRYAEKLKCDILQMPHHALCDAYCVDFYRFVDPQILLMPISIAGYRSMHSRLYEQREGYVANLCVEAKAKEVYKAFEGTTELNI